MVNYKRVVCEVVFVVALVNAATAAPAADCADRKPEQHYDQRQNGTENYRLNIDGVVIAVAPAETLLSAASELDFGDLLDLQDYDSLKPPSDNKPQESKPQSGKPGDKPDGEKPAAAPLSDVSLSSDGIKGQKKEAFNRKQEKAHRLKMRLANMLLPLLKRNRHN